MTLGAWMRLNRPAERLGFLSRRLNTSLFRFEVYGVWFMVQVFGHRVLGRGCRGRSGRGCARPAERLWLSAEDLRILV